MVGCNRVGDVLQEHGLAGSRRRNDQAALPLAKRGEQIHEAGAYILATGFELDPLLRIKRRQIVEENLVARLVGRLEVDGFNLDQREILFALVWGTDLSADSIAGLKVKFSDLRRRNVDVVGAGQIVVIGRA